VTTLAVGQAIQHRRELADDFGVEIREAAAELRAAERGNADLREKHAARTVGGQLDEEEVETAGQRALGIQHVELGAKRRPQILDDLVDGRDQQVFLRLEVVVHQPGRQAGFLGDALHRGFGDAVLQDRRAQAVDDLAAPRSSETPASHK
jgi:hypothetical protein